MRRSARAYQLPIPIAVPEGAVFIRLEGMKTRNPNNGAQGWSRNAAFAKARRRKQERTAAHTAVWARRPKLPPSPWRITITRVAPSAGLDMHDGLGAALKGVIDGTADGLGLTNDRDPVVMWILSQRRGAMGEYAVELLIEHRKAA